MYNVAMATASKNKPVVYVALLRGINVGGKSIVSMAALKACFEKLGLSDVRTYINSGNIIFTSDEKDAEALTGKVEAAIQKATGLDIKATLRTAAQMKAVVKRIPVSWKNDGTMKSDVFFLWNDVDSPKILKEFPHNPAVDTLVYMKGALAWNVARENYGKSRVTKVIGTPLYKKTTGRNVNTVRKLVELMESET